MRHTFSRGRTARRARSSGRAFRRTSALRESVDLSIEILYNRGGEVIRLKISTRGRYAIRILLDIAMHQEHGPVAMKDIARRQQISKKYGDQIGMQLSQGGLLLAARGRQGGYRLIPAPKDVSVLEALRIMEGSMAPVQCLETTPNRCDRCEFCMTLPLWSGLYRVMSEYLGNITLQDLIDQAVPQPECEDMPVPD